MQTTTTTTTTTGAPLLTPCESCGQLTEPRLFKGRARWAHTCQHGHQCPAGLRKSHKSSGCPVCAGVASYAPPPPAAAPAAPKAVKAPRAAKVATPSAAPAAPKAPRAPKVVDRTATRLLALQALADLENAIVTGLEAGITPEQEKAFARYQRVLALALGIESTPNPSPEMRNEADAALRQALIGAIKLAL